MAVQGDIVTFSDTSGQNVEDSGVAVATITSEIAALQSSVASLQTAVDAAQTNAIDVFVAGGQSNMQGAGTAGTIAVPAGKVLQFYNGVISDANDPVGNALHGSCLPAFGLAYYAATGRKVCVVPSAFGGTAQVAAADTLGNGNWDTSGTLRTTLVSNGNAALAALTAAGYTPNFRGVLWAQGETDAEAIDTSTITGSQYTTAFTTMLAYYRSVQFAGKVYPELPVYLSLLGGPYDDDDAGYQTVRAAQQAVVAADVNTIIAFSGALDFLTTGLMQPSNSPHYSQAGYNKMGHDLAQGVLLGGESNSRVAKTRHIFSFSTFSASLSAGSGYFFGQGSISASGGVDTAVAHLTVTPGTLKNLVVVAENAPGVGENITFTVRIANVDTPLAVVMSGTNNFVKNTLNVVAVGIQSVSIHAVLSGSATPGPIIASLEYDAP